jgi:hypothetical protein
MRTITLELPDELEIEDFVIKCILPEHFMKKASSRWDSARKW